MFMCCTKRSSVINLIYSGQLNFSYTLTTLTTSKTERNFLLLKYCCVGEQKVYFKTVYLNLD
jgi:hypothetical protein